MSLFMQTFRFIGIHIIIPVTWIFLLFMTISLIFPTPTFHDDSDNREIYTLSLLHFNDIYHASPDENGIGGFAKLKTAIDFYRNQNDKLIVTFGGDLLTTSLGNTLLTCKQILELSNKLGIDVAVIGNHEYLR